MLNPRPAVRKIPQYHPPLAGREGLRLDFNENTVGCSPRVLERLRQLGPEDLARYPERAAVEAQVADYLGVAASETLLTNGVDEAIHLLCQTYIEPGDEALIVVPTYSMYRIYMTAAGGQIISVAAGKDFQFPARDLQQQITQRTRLIAIANPNNPTGTVATREELLQIAGAARDAAILIDEAYFEFYGGTLLADRRDFPNLFVARTFSKAYGLAGLRAGVLVGNAEQMHAVRLICSPYNVNAAALACLPTALADRTYIEQYVGEVRESRARLAQALEANHIPYWPSEGNFILARVGLTKTDAAAFVDRMRRRGILVRDRSSDPGCEGCVRITLGPRQHGDRLLISLRQTLNELGLAQNPVLGASHS